MNVDRLRELAQYLPPGPWAVRRSDVDGSLILWHDDWPLAQIYAGHDVALYLAECAPALLFGDDDEQAAP